MLARLWIFADAQDVPLLQNVASDLLLEKVIDSRTFPCLDDLSHIYHNTVESSRLRHLIAEVYQVLCDRELSWEELVDKDNEEEVPPSTALKQPMKYSNLRLWQSHCKFHVHEVGVTCKR